MLHTLLNISIVKYSFVKELLLNKYLKNYLSYLEILNIPLYSYFCHKLQSKEQVALLSHLPKLDKLSS